MIFYLGDKIKPNVPQSEIKQRNKLGKWKYGYDETLDAVIISKDGTVGDIYHVQGLNIALPEKPPKDKILNYDKPTQYQKWERTELPDALTDASIDYELNGEKDDVRIQEILDRIYSENFDFIEEEFRRRDEGVWCMIKGNEVYIPGTYYYGIQWVREEVRYPSFRAIQNDLMIFWQACKADQRCFGMQYVKNRRMGASLLSIFELLESASIYENKINGIISKTGEDARLLFERLVNGFKRLPMFFKPVTDGTTSPKKKLIFDEPTRRRRKGEKMSAGSGLSSNIAWYNTVKNAMDGSAIFRSLLDESGKYPKEVPFDAYWRIVKTSHKKGIVITGKSMVISTVNSFKDGGLEYFKVWKQSNLDVRDGNGQTKSGLYRIFIAAKYCLEGMFDEYGFTILEDPKEPTKTDEGAITKIGSVTWLQNEADALKGDPDAYNEHKRQFPDTIKDAFRDSSDDCEFNLMNIQEQLEHNEHELNDFYGEGEEDWRGNDDVERGNFVWQNGVQDTVVEWKPNAEGRFFIKKGCHPPEQFKNQYEEKYSFGRTGKSPLGKHIGVFGVDPYNRSKNADGRGSKGAIILTTKEHTCDELPNNAMIVEYIDRPKKVTLFFEDVIMVSVYYSIPFLSELSNERFLAYVKDRGYRHYSMNNPFKTWNDLSPTEKEFGGAPQQDTKIGEAQFYATESFVEDHLGVAKDKRFRMLGEMGDMPFSRTLRQIKDVDTSNRTKYDAYIGFSLSRVGCQKRTIKKKQVEQGISVGEIFKTYNNIKSA